MEERTGSTEDQIARVLVAVARRADAAPLQPDPGVAAAWDGIAEACEVIADHARFMRDRAGGRWRR